MQAILLRKTGMKYKKIAKIIGVYPSRVSKWCRTHNKKDFKAIKIKKRGRRTCACGTLNAEQEKQIPKAIVDKEQDKIKPLLDLWMRITAQQFIKRLYAIDKSIRTVGEYLKR
jgi:transposase